jgi:hypothetical protein
MLKSSVSSLTFAVRVAAGLVLLNVAVAQTDRFNTQTPSATAVDPANFVSKVTNEFFPLRPGTTFFYEGTKSGIPSSNETTVTHEVKQILGVNCTVVRDNAFENRALVERTIDWYAQDKTGNVWYFGEYSEELDANGGVISTQGSWEAGVNGASPGIVMEAEPRVGDRYRQEVAPSVAEDTALVLSLDKSVCVRYGCFEDLLLTKETSPLKPGIVERKYYAEEVGFIRGDMVKGGNEHTELVRISPPPPKDHRD